MPFTTADGVGFVFGYNAVDDHYLAIAINDKCATLLCFDSILAFAPGGLRQPLTELVGRFLKSNATTVALC